MDSFTFEFEAWSGAVFALATVVIFAVGFWRTRLRGFLLLTIGTALQLVEFAIDYYEHLAMEEVRATLKIASIVLFFIANSLNLLGAVTLAFSARWRHVPTI
jgi:hypothetical protein